MVRSVLNSAETIRPFEPRVERLLLWYSQSCHYLSEVCMYISFIMTYLFCSHRVDLKMSLDLWDHWLASMNLNLESCSK